MVICDFFPGSGEVVPCAHQGKEKSRRYVLDMQARLHFAAKRFTANIADINWYLSTAPGSLQNPMAPSDFHLTEIIHKTYFCHANDASNPG